MWRWPVGVTSHHFNHSLVTRNECLFWLAFAYAIFSPLRFYFLLRLSPFSIDQRENIHKIEFAPCTVICATACVTQKSCALSPTTQHNSTLHSHRFHPPSTPAFLLHPLSPPFSRFLYAVIILTLGGEE
uniref:Uncharacterized protein n=1 Tax=Trypanosoma vivax (strain Y486) TaxID=1055687 RepID=G0TTN8_TRYVY|nr:hypothetical protein, unlikely [Trypanosoma vivax Y486]